MARLAKLFLCAVLLAAATAGCASSNALRLGETAELDQDYDRAVLEYTRALREDPDDTAARQGLQRSRLRAALNHLTRGRRLEAAGRVDEALVELQIAAELNPDDPNIAELLDDVRNQIRTGIIAARSGKTELEELIERSQSFEPGLALPPATLPDSLVFRDASAREVFTALARFANISIAFDPQFRDQSVTIEFQNASLGDALTALTQATQTFYRVTTQRSITVIPDTPAKRTEYEPEVVQTFFLSNADAKETMDMLRLVADLRRIGPVSGINAISVKDTPERVAAAGRLIAAIDKARPEVVIDVELLEFDRTRLREYGLQIASPGSPGIDGQVNINRDTPLTLEDLTNLSQSDVFFTNLPALFYRLLKSDSNTRALANTQLRTSEGMRAQARFGERVPVPVTVFAPIATGGVAQQPITSFNYQDIGVNIDITPRTHHDGEVSLALEVTVSNISGTGFGDLPTFGNRQINTVIRLRDGETNLLAGLIRDDERNVVEGVPGLIDMPLVGRLFANNRRESRATDIVLTLTPRIVRVLDVTEEDLRPFEVGRGGVTPGAQVDLPIILQQTPATPVPAPAAPPPPPSEVPPVVVPIEPPPTAPILPPPPVQPTPQP